MLNKTAGSEYIFDKKHQIFLNFIDHTDQVKNAVQYIEKILPSIIQKNPTRTDFHYLDIGCGYGYKTNQLSMLSGSIVLLIQRQMLNTKLILWNQN